MTVWCGMQLNKEIQQQIVESGLKFEGFGFKEFNQ